VFIVSTAAIMSSLGEESSVVERPISTALGRLDPGATVRIGSIANGEFREPRQFTVTKQTEESPPRVETAAKYRRVYLEDHDGIRYVVHSFAKPPEKGQCSVPEIFRCTTSDTSAEHYQEKSEGSINYLQILSGSGV
jgi:hypothetical protein